MHRGQTTTVGPTAKCDAVGASTRRTCPAVFGNHHHCLARPVSRLVGIHCVSPPCLQHIEPAEPRGARQSAARCTGARPTSNSWWLSPRSHTFDPIRTFVSSVTIELVPAR